MTRLIEERDVITLMSLKDGQAKDACCVEIFKVLESDEVAACSEYSTSAMRGGVKTHSFNTTNLITHLKSHHPGQYEKFVKIKQEKETLVKKSSRLSTLFTEAKRTMNAPQGKKHHSETPEIYM